MKKILILALLIIISCQRKPDLIINGQGYYINTQCIKSHTESKFGPHFGYNFKSGKYEWHTGNYTESVCDSTATDTIKIEN